MDNNDFKGHSVIAEDEEQTSFGELLMKYLYHWKWYALSIVISIALAFTYIKITTPLFQIETDLLIKQDKNNANAGAGDDILKSMNLFSSDKIIDNEVQILRSYTLTEKVIKALGLEVSYYGVGSLRKYPIYDDQVPFSIRLIKPIQNSYKKLISIKVSNKNTVEIAGKKFQINTPVQTDFGLLELTCKNFDDKVLNREFYVKFNTLSELYQTYSSVIGINPVSKEGTVLIITLQDAVPQRGKDILNRLVYEYNNAAIADKNKVTSSTLSFINERLKSLSEELGIAEKNVESYKSANRITDISAQSQVFMQGVQQNDADLSKVNIQLSVLKNLETYVENEQGKLPSMLGVDDPTLLALVSQLGDAELRKTSLLQTIPDTNPIVNSVNDQIKALKSAITQSIQNLKSGLLVTQQQLQDKNTTFESVIQKVPSKERGLLDVMRQQDIKNTLFNFLLQKREEQAMSLASNLADSRTIDVARSSELPVKPVMPLVLGLFVFLGVAMPTGVIYFRDILNNKIKKRADIEKFTGIPILAEIAQSDESAPLVAVEKPRSMLADQIRALRTNLQFISADQTSKVLLFTSGISGEGKSFVSLNLGGSLAMSGKRVVILELDLRRPKLHPVLGIENKQGLSNYLVSKMSYKEIIHEIKQQPNYFIITCGQIPPNPAELLTNGRIEVLLNELKKDFDYVIMDAPPVGLVTDAQILGKFANATLFMLRHNYTLKSQVALLDELYRSNKFPNLNIVYNSVDYSGGYGYGYGYGYGGGYYEEPVKKASWLPRLFGKK